MMMIKKKKSDYTSRDLARIVLCIASNGDFERTMCRGFLQGCVNE